MLELLSNPNYVSSSLSVCADYRSTDSYRAGWVPTQEVNRSCSANPSSVMLTEHRELFEAKKKAGAVFVDLTAAYDTVWRHGLTCKLLRLRPDKHMVRMIMEFVWSGGLPLVITHLQ